jgi:hypothetical protein
MDHIIWTAELLNHCWFGAVQSAAFAARVRVERRRMLLNFILVVWVFGLRMVMEKDVCLVVRWAYLSSSPRLQ